MAHFIIQMDWKYKRKASRSYGETEYKKFNHAIRAAKQQPNPARLVLVEPEQLKSTTLFLKTTPDHFNPHKVKSFLQLKEDWFIHKLQTRKTSARRIRKNKS